MHIISININFYNELSAKECSNEFASSELNSSCSSSSLGTANS